MAISNNLALLNDGGLQEDSESSLEQGAFAPLQPEETNVAPVAAPAADGGHPNWKDLVDRVQAHDPEACSELYRTFSRGVRFYLCRHLGPQELEDKVHDVYIIVLEAIQRRELRDPEKLMGFVRTVVRRQLATYIDKAVQQRHDMADMEVGGRVPDVRTNPEQQVIAREKADIMRKVLNGISRRDREILTRFYLKEQTQDQICLEMQLTETQFRLLKSRAKARFGELGRRRLESSSISSIFLRKSQGDAD